MSYKDKTGQRKGPPEENVLSQNYFKSFLSYNDNVLQQGKHNKTRVKTYQSIRPHYN